MGINIKISKCTNYLISITYNMFMKMKVIIKLPKMYEWDKCILSPK